MLSAWRRAFRDCMATTVINCGKLCSILHATRECNKKQHWRRTCGQRPWANKNQQRKILPVSQPSTDSITMTSMTVRKAKYAKCIKATAQIPDCRKLSCFHALAGGLAIQGCICSHWSQDIFKRNIKNDKAVPRLHLKRTSWVPAVDPLQASRGVYIKLYHRYSPDWHGPSKLWYAKVGIFRKWIQSKSPSISTCQHGNRSLHEKCWSCWAGLHGGTLPFTRSPGLGANS